jgi:hypothetical protein
MRARSSCFLKKNRGKQSCCIVPLTNVKIVLTTNKFYQKCQFATNIVMLALRVKEKNADNSKSKKL